MKYTTIIFDLDGTLLNTLDDLVNSANYALSYHNLPLRSRDEIRSFVGNGVHTLISRAVPDKTSTDVVTSVLQTFKEHYILHMNDFTAPYEGIQSLLKELKEKGIKTAIVSNKYDTAVKQLASEHFNGFITTAKGESLSIPKKPAPDNVLSVLSELHEEPNHCLYVGDSDVDMLTAKNANVTSVGVTWGFRSRECLIESGANYIIDTPLELLSLL